MPRIALEKEERGRRPRGRLRGRWEDQVWKDIERRGLQKMLVEEEETWNDRHKWKRLCTTTRDNGNRLISDAISDLTPGIWSHVRLKSSKDNQRQRSSKRNIYIV
ncbi:hypothetical protein J6590_010847 [Homalodisca vitripennis]|nr:hypothetical protein J6590_010847 [Homalodisca vitripennis]